MIEIYLDGQLAIPKENQTIKLTSENSFFTKSASYTYDVELPLAIEANRRIFGNIHRLDFPKEPRTMQAVLNVDNVTVLTGSAHITSVSDTSVKVQLLGEAASYNYGNKMDETYIDELDLGNWYMVTWPDGSHWNPRQERWDYFPEDTKFKGNTYLVFNRAIYNDDGTWSRDNIFPRIYNGTFPWVAFPVINSNDDFMCNGFSYRYTTADHSTVKPIFRGYNGENTSRPTENPAVLSSAIQPFVWIIAELVAKATGFTLSRDDNALFKNSFFKRIFIVTACNMIECNKSLPHWSVNDFWTQIENTFGLVISMDYTNKKMYLRQRSEYYRNSAKVVCIKNVVDEYSADVDDETQVDISANSVGFADFDANPYDLLDEYISGNCDVNTDFNSINDLLAWAKANKDSLTDYKGTLFKCKDGRHFIYSEAEGIVEVNQFRPRLADESKEDVDVELKFVPARFTEGECEIFDHIPSGSGSGYGPNYIDRPIASFPAQMLQVPDISQMDWAKKSGDTEIDIEAILNEEEEEVSTDNNKEDKIFLAVIGDNPYDKLTVNITFEDGNILENKQAFFPRPRIRERTKAALTDSQATKEDSPYSLSLIPVEGQENLAKHTIADSVKIATKVRHCIKFVADRIPDPASIFLIHNRRFVCEKIEADVTSNGLRHLLTGYFYELDL